MLAAASLAFLLGSGLAACSRSGSSDSGAKPTASTPIVAPSAAPSAAVPAASLAVEPPAPVDAGRPRRVARGDGITLTETSDGQVVIKTRSLWNEPIETTYTSCEYYKGAIPVLKRQLSEERSKLLTRVCNKAP